MPVTPPAEQLVLDYLRRVADAANRTLRSDERLQFMAGLRAAIERRRGEAGADKLGFEYLDGPVTPKPEKIPPVRPKSKRRGGGGVKRAKPPGPRGDGGAPPPSRGSVPKIPLVKV